MSNFIPLNVDYVIGLDPGYATQGIAIIDVRDEPHLSYMYASTTDPEHDQATRVSWQIGKLAEVLQRFGQRQAIALNALLVLEEFHAIAGGRQSPMSVYYRGWYDATLRREIAPKVRASVTVHPLHVRAWSGPELPPLPRLPKGQKRDKKDKPKPPSAEEIVDYNLKFYRDVCEVQASRLLETVKADCLGKSQSRTSTVIHAADSFVMACMGVAAYVREGWRRGRTPKQQGWIDRIREIYDFTQAGETR